MKTVKVFAPAKINLTLHITGQRDDGYHLLDSLVTFATVGDQLYLTEAGVFSLTVEGPEAEGVPADMDNLALKAAHFAGAGREAAMTLTKNLPSSSGIGGGSADAAAAWRGMLMLGEDGDTQVDTQFQMPDIMFETQVHALSTLGADVPMCVASRPLRARGIGEKITFHSLPPLFAVLVNPRVPVSTPEVFKRLASKSNMAMPESLPDFENAAAMIEWLKTQRNDLEAPAIENAPVIGEVLARLGDLANLGLARMSGSGATCFALFDNETDAKVAARELYAERPDWWVAGCVLQDMFLPSLPR
ncbi:MAG: 4-(cytidine 5'-diphospho)-2-C-methyl-D-erythritol kinase [Boseongicola sp.]|nr:4-(cytidine 5'-diphospho)-2-C-methyl-D-erythritol kinase [Boseongicola sp.]